MSLHIQENTDNKVDNQDGVVITLKEIFHPLIVKQLCPPILSLLSEYSHVFSKNKYDLGKIRIESTRINLTSDSPVSQRAYRTSAAEEVEINKQVKNLLAAGLIKESNSCYSSPVTLVYKRDEMKKTRLCIDYRKLNAICKTDTEPLPLIDTLLDKLTHAKIFSTLDFASGYWHISLHENDKEKLAFVTSEGLCEFQDLPIGFRNSPAILNRTIRRILNKHKCSTFACHYFDDIVIFSNSLEKHYAHLEEIFKICEEENTKLKFSKCVFAKDKINILGYEIKEGCIIPENHNIESIQKLQPPKNVKQLQGFLCSVNFYNKLIDSYAKIRKPLNQLLKKDKQWHWTAECQKASELLKQIVEEARKLAKKNAIKYHDKHKIKYDARFIDSPFKAGDIVMYEEFNDLNRR
ncbi:Transposon Ty3-I Gag-Pol polyprotein [Araneus ventricosus]|uniref:RNA-directed DNA polymerase n=1 Tax=Araneus ventricosus TaxID=182803 RepID=A0A4Y2MJY4_ARAVE|nr:Transposon Ty3-I Gag-Pol polyprotein [Araneus ventricosus]